MILWDKADGISVLSESYISKVQEYERDGGWNWMELLLTILLLLLPGPEEPVSCIQRRVVETN
jgi:hypothetical protein